VVGELVLGRRSVEGIQRSAVVEVVAVAVVDITVGVVVDTVATDLRRVGPQGWFQFGDAGDEPRVDDSDHNSFAGGGVPRFGGVDVDVTVERLPVPRLAFGVEMPLRRVAGVGRFPRHVRLGQHQIFDRGADAGQCRHLVVFEVAGQGHHPTGQILGVDDTVQGLEMGGDVGGGHVGRLGQSGLDERLGQGGIEIAELTGSDRRPVTGLQVQTQPVLPTRRRHRRRVERDQIVVEAVGIGDRLGVDHRRDLYHHRLDRRCLAGTAATVHEVAATTTAMAVAAVRVRIHVTCLFSSMRVPGGFNQPPPSGN
jgi:hypothetical protein